MQANFRLLEVTCTLFHKLLPTHDLMEATLVFTTLTYLHHCFLFSLCWVRMMQISFCSLFIQKGVRAFANQNFDWTGKRWFSTVNWACKLSSTNHRSLILKHGYPLKLNAVFEKWDKRYFVRWPIFLGWTSFWFVMFVYFANLINTLYTCMSA